MSNDAQWSQVQIISNIQRLSPLSSPRSRHSMTPLIAKLPSPANLMESSLLQSQKTTNITEQLSQLNLKMKQFSQYEEDLKCSNLERLKNLPRNIQKDSKIKIECKTEFPLVRAVALGEFGWTLMTKQNHKELVNVIWTDSYVTEQLVNRLRPYQKINHFPYSTQMGRKDYLFANLNRMREKHKEEYEFFAKTWIFPQDYARFKEQTLGQSSNNDKFYIVKPVASCQGKGIHLCRRQQVLYHNSGYHSLLVQQYISNPLLLQQLKFDTRLYVLVKSLQPLQLYLYDQGLTRLATAPYQPPSQQNYRNTRMHLTNYAINKNNPAFVNNRDYNDDAQGHKRSLSSMYEEVGKKGGDVGKIKVEIDKIIVKTILAVYEKMTYLEHVSMKQKELIAGGNNNITKDSIQKNLPIIQSNEDGLFSTLPSKSPIITNQKAPKSSFQLYLQKKLSTSPKCFQLLGFDIMLTDKFEPKLIEINHQPSLTASSPLDFVIKKCLVMDVFGLLGVDSRQKERYLSEKKDKLQVKGDRKQAKYMFGAQFNKRQQNLGGFKCIYPTQKPQQKQLYHRLMPLLTLSQQPNRHKLNHNGSYHPFSSSSPLSKEPQLSFRQPRTSLQTRRKEYTCNYINMFTNGTLISHFQHLPGGGYLQQTSGNQQQNDCAQNQQDNENRAMIRFSQNDARISEPPEIRYSKNKIKVNLSKMEQIELPKKNLNFTIKYKRNSTSSNNRANSLNPKVHSQMQQQQSSPQHSSLSNKPTQHTPLVPNITQLIPSQSKTSTTKAPSPSIDKPTAHPNQLSIINQQSIFNPMLHLTNDHSQQSRIAIKLVNQNLYDKDKANFSLITKNLSLESSRGHCFSSRNDRNLANSQQRNTRQTMQVEKYAYPVFEKGKAIMSRKSKSLMSNTYTSIPIVSHQPIIKTLHQQPQRPIQRHQQYCDSIYEKQLMMRLGKMKTMKQKLERLKKNYTNKMQPNVVSPSQFAHNKFVEDQKECSIKQIDRLQSLQSHQVYKNTGNQQKPKPYQTIRLLQFQQPQLKRNRHTHNEKRERMNITCDNSLELFEDKAILRKQSKNKNQDNKKLS